MSRFAAVFGMYAFTIALVGGIVASSFLGLLTEVGPGMLVFVTLVGTLLVGTVGAVVAERFHEYDLDDADGSWLPLVPLFLSVVAAGPAVLVGGSGPIGVAGANEMAVTTPQLVASALSLGAVVLPAIPMAAHRSAWQRVTDRTEATPLDDEACGTDGLPVDGFGESLATDLPARLDVHTIDVPTPGVYLFDDGRRAVLAFTDGALDALDDRERDAIVAREVVQVVERGAVPQFWASALALAVEGVLDPVETETYAARAGGKVRLPFWFVGPLKLLATVACLFVFFVLYAGSLSEYLPVSGVVLGVVYAIGTLLVGVGLSRAARGLASYLATANVVTADERGAAFANDAGALVSALRTLHAASDEYREAHEDDDPNALGALDALAVYPTDRVPVTTRERALEAVADRLGDRDDGLPRRDSTPEQPRRCNRE